MQLPYGSFHPVSFLSSINTVGKHIPCRISIVYTSYIRYGIRGATSENMYRYFHIKNNQRTSGPVNAHLISWPSKAQNIQNLENIR